MNISAKEFIEQNIDLIDKNDFVTLYMNLYEHEDFGWEEALEVGIILGGAGIDFKAQREEALGRIITPNIELWCIGDGGVSAMPLSMFIEAFLGNRMGVGISMITKYMLNHKQEWEQYVDIITNEFGEVIIQRRFN